MALLTRTFHTVAVFCGKRCHDAAAASGVAQICNLPYRRFSIGRVFSVAPHPGHCRRPAEYNSAIQQIENLRYEYEISRLAERRELMERWSGGGMGEPVPQRTNSPTP